MGIRLIHLYVVTFYEKMSYNGQKLLFHEYCESLNFHQCFSDEVFSLTLRLIFKQLGHILILRPKSALLSHKD